LTQTSGRYSRRPRGYPPPRADVVREDGRLAVLLPAGRGGVLAVDPGRTPPLFAERNVGDDYDAVRGCERGRHPGPIPTQDAVGTPRAVGNEPLESLRGRPGRAPTVRGPFPAGQRFQALPAGFREQTPQVDFGPRDGLHAREQARVGPHVVFEPRIGRTFVLPRPIGGIDRPNGGTNNPSVPPAGRAVPPRDNRRWKCGGHSCHKWSHNSGYVTIRFTAARAHTLANGGWALVRGHDGLRPTRVIAWAIPREKPDRLGDGVA
jgi:hypothetical protein